MQWLACSVAACLLCSPGTKRCRTEGFKPGESEHNTCSGCKQRKRKEEFGSAALDRAGSGYLVRKAKCRTCVNNCASTRKGPQDLGHELARHYALGQHCSLAQSCLLTVVTA